MRGGGPEYGCPRVWGVADGPRNRPLRAAPTPSQRPGQGPTGPAFVGFSGPGQQPCPQLCPEGRPREGARAERTFSSWSGSTHEGFRNLGKAAETRGSPWKDSGVTELLGRGGGAAESPGNSSEDAFAQKHTVHLCTVTFVGTVIGMTGLMLLRLPPACVPSAPERPRTVPADGSGSGRPPHRSPRSPGLGRQGLEIWKQLII